MREDPVPSFLVGRMFNKLTLFAGMVVCMWLLRVFAYSRLGSLAVSAALTGIILLYIEVLMEQIIEATRGNSSTPGASARGPSGNQAQKEQS
jgi:hypothetical protein